MATTNLTCTSPGPPALNLNYRQSACGLKGYASNLETCCGGANNTHVIGGCWQWCLFNGTLPDFAACVSTAGTLRTDTFCQRNQSGSSELQGNCGTLTGAAGGRMRPLQKTSVLLALVVILGIFTSGVVADTGHASLGRRLDSCGSSVGPLTYSCGDKNQSCTSFTPTLGPYNKVGNATTVSNVTSCDSTSPCSKSVPIHYNSTYCSNMTDAFLASHYGYCGIHFHRTLKAADTCTEPCDTNYGSINAEDGAFDPLFNIIAETLNSYYVGACDGATPLWTFNSDAQIKATYDYWMSAGTSSYLTIAPLLLCQRGTVGGCTGNVLANISSGIVESGKEIEACQIVFIDEQARRNMSISPGAVEPQVFYSQVLVD